MAVQTGSVCMVALGVAADAQLSPGVHLRWFVDPARGFPPKGFSIYRRPHRPNEAQLFDFASETPRDLTSPFRFGPMVWATTSLKAALVTASPQGAPPRTVLAISGRGLCRFDAALHPVRRVEIDFIGRRQPPRGGVFDLWGLAGRFWALAGERLVTLRSRVEWPPDRDIVSTIDVRGDVLEGFAFWGEVELLQVRWYSARDPETPQEPLWDPQPLNTRPIGFPVTVPGYEVVHGHGPDQGQGDQDWAEAAARLVPPSTVPPLESLVRRFGPPVFARTRTLLGQALRREPLVGAASGEEPEIRLDPVAMTLVGSLDADAARMFGLSYHDATAQPGQLYDYKLVATWPEKVPGWVCEDVVIPILPRGGTGTIDLPRAVNRVSAGRRRPWDCRWRDVFATEEWICWEVSLTNPPPVPRPKEVAARVLPGFPRLGRATNQVVALRVEDQRPPTGLLPPALLPHDAIAYQTIRRSDGIVPGSSTTEGLWIDLGRDPTDWSWPAVRSLRRPPMQRDPAGWPHENQDVLDLTTDPDTPFYSYRLRGRDLFGRLGDWSDVVNVDAGDRVGPPAPDRLEARWIEATDSWLGAGDRALLVGAGLAAAVRVRWSWPPSRHAQAMDAAAFRVYWHGRPFWTMAGTITSVQLVGPGQQALIEMTVPALAGGPPPSENLFADDWLRQANGAYWVRASSSTDPLQLTVSFDGAALPQRGPGHLALRPPDPQRLDLLGNLLRPNPAAAAAWERRLLEGPLTIISGHRMHAEPDAAVSIAEVLAEAPRAGHAIVRLAPSWRWAGRSPAAELELRAGDTVWRVRGGELDEAPSLVVATDGRPAPLPGPATLAAPSSGMLRTVVIGAALLDSAPFTIRGGTLVGTEWEAEVLAHRAPAPGEIAFLVWGEPQGSGLTWLPDHEALLTDLDLPVDAATPEASAVVGVSARDARAYVQDMRQRPGEPTGPGNEGPLAHITVRRHYRSVPEPAPAPTAPVAELWAEPPDPFSGISSFRLRWPGGSAGLRWRVLHASLDAVLDADQADRAAARGAYAGQPPLSGAALADWRARQTALDPADLQALATAHPGVFRPVGDRLIAADDLGVADPENPGGLHWPATLDGSAPGRHFLRLVAFDAAGNAGLPGPATPPIRVPDLRRPMAPALRRIWGGSRAVWLVWDAAEPDVAAYRIYRSRLPGGSRPDLRDMDAVAELIPGQCPEPLPVVGGELRLPGPVPTELIAVYDALDYDVSRPPVDQFAAPITDALTLSGATVTGLTTLGEGDLAYVVVQYAQDAPQVLVGASAACAYRDDAAVPHLPQQYRMVAVRWAQADATTRVLIRSFPSDVGQATAIDLSMPEPPAASAAWLATERTVRVSWPVASYGGGLQLALQRRAEGEAGWTWVSGWMPAIRGQLNDANAAPGRAYSYRLRARNGTGRISRDEPLIGPVVVP